MTDVTQAAMDWALAADPVTATWLGDHRFDGHLPDFSVAGVSRFRSQAERWLDQIDAVDDEELSVDEVVDLQVVRAQIAGRLFAVAEVQRHTWDPMVWNPGTALHLLLNRDYGDATEQRTHLLERVRAIPDFLSDARTQLQNMSAIHRDTAIDQLHGTARMLDDGVRARLDDDPTVAAAHTVTLEFIEWLRREDARRTPRLGEWLYAGTLWHSLDDETSAVRMLEAAESHLDAVTEQMREVASNFLGESGQPRHVVTRALDAIATSAPTSAATIRSQVEAALTATRDFVQQHSLVTMPEVDVRVIDMPVIHQGVAVAYCDAPGPLETATLPTFVAVAPPPSTWTAETTESFYREYNAVAIHNLTIHEAYPGHVLQLGRAAEGLSAPRGFGRSGTFIEGWAVYAEKLMVERGYATVGGTLALQLQQLKFQARMTINAILDVRVHTMEMTEDEALSLMVHRGFQEPGEAVGKWRRALLTAGQLPTYFVGFQAVCSIVDDLRVLHPTWSDQQLHDQILGYGSVAPRHIRTLLGI
jgi:uncharacterized protein (DUF885 family)